MNDGRVLAHLVRRNVGDADFLLDWGFALARIAATDDAVDEATFVDMFAADLLCLAGDDPRASPLVPRLIAATAGAPIPPRPPSKSQA